MTAVRTWTASLGGAVALTLGDKLLLLGALLLVLVFVFVLLGSPTRSAHLVAIIDAVRGRTDSRPEPAVNPSPRRRFSRRRSAGGRG